MQKEHDQNGNSQSEPIKTPGEWTKEEMEEAEPAPMPVPDEEE